MPCKVVICFSIICLLCGCRAIPSLGIATPGLLLSSISATNPAPQSGNQSPANKTDHPASLLPAQVRLGSVSQSGNGTDDKRNDTSSTASTPEYIPDYELYCALWNSSCPGNSRLAWSYFDEMVSWRNGAMCHWSECTVKEKDVPPASKMAFADLIEFARSDKCASMYGPHISLEDSPFTTPHHYMNMGPCCGPCHFVPTIVDLYYWPVQDADTSCLSLIGDTVNAPDYGATTSTAIIDPGVSTKTEVLWNCVTASSLVNGITSFGYLSTATLATVGSITYKKLDYNPWFPPSICLNTSNQDQLSLSVSSISAGKQLSIRVHPRSIVAPPQSAAHPGNGSSMTQVIAQQDGFAL